MRILLLFSIFLYSAASYSKCGTGQEKYIKVSVKSCVSYSQQFINDVPPNKETIRDWEIEAANKDANNSSIIKVIPIEEIEVIRWLSNGYWRSYQGKSTKLESSEVEYFMNVSEEYCNKNFKGNTNVFLQKEMACCDTGRLNAVCWTKLPILELSESFYYDLKVNCSLAEFSKNKSCTAINPKEK